MIDPDISAKEKLFAEEFSKKLREKRKREESRKKLEEQLIQASGINDRTVIGKLIDLEIDPDTLAALALVPLVEVAWADHKMDREEREAILEAAGRHGIEPCTPGREMLESWLKERPGRHLLDTWKEYASALVATLRPEMRVALKDSIMGQARAVAEETGGILGLGNKISTAERKMLDELEEVFA